MAYPGFQTVYPQMYYPQYQPQQQAQQTSGITWIQGEAAAKSYLVAPNNSVVLFDSESQTIYIKSADASGMPSMKILDYTIRQAPGNGPTTPASAQTINNIDYATRAEISALQGEINALKAELENMTKKGASSNE